jgi:hypothetical protein
MRLRVFFQMHHLFRYLPAGNCWLRRRSVFTAGIITRITLGYRSQTGFHLVQDISNGGLSNTLLQNINTPATPFITDTTVRWNILFPLQGNEFHSLQHVTGSHPAWALYSLQITYIAPSFRHDQGSSNCPVFSALIPNTWKVP